MWRSQQSESGLHSESGGLSFVGRGGSISGISGRGAGTDCRNGARFPGFLTGRPRRSENVRLSLTWPLGTAHCFG